MADVVGLDKILRHVGDFGTIQVISLTLILVITIFDYACHMAYVFTAMEIDSRCLIPGCDENSTSYGAEYVNFAIPHDSLGKHKKCERFLRRNKTNGLFSCSADVFDRNETSLCDEFVFENEEVSIAKEYHLLCEDDIWTLSLVGTINTLGMMLGIWISGYLSDRYGRKIVLLFGVSLGGLVGVSKTFVPRFEVFCFLEFLEAFIQAGSHCSVFVLATELVTPEHRFLTACFYFTVCSCGQVVLAAVAWIVKNWRLIIYIFYIPCIFSICFYPLILESLRWQLSKGDIERAKYTLNKIAKSNKKSIPRSYFHNLQKTFIEQSEKCQKLTLAQMIKSRILLLRLMIAAFLWIMNALLLYGLTLSSMFLTGNEYLNYLLVASIEIPAYWMMLLMSGKMKRKTLLGTSYFFTAASCFSFLFFISDDLGWLRLILHCCAKFGTSASFYVLYLITTEMFPTPLRQSTMGLCSMIGRIGSLVSPQVSLMSILWLPLPNVIFALAAFLSGSLTFSLPETFAIELPDTIEEAKNIGKRNEHGGIQRSC